ncbi:peptidoglycan/LPS O-acetylase OafA/YrhL [Paraburkholderia sp. GAS199]|uniref:acyltransferase family protein n=1 Tax=Paraburkholderia sp. GAS199 TaxID=3035126 RepID=UPI003D25C8D3
MDRDGRYAQLDALRGVAALTVVFSHFTLLAPLLGLRHTPLRLLLGGHEAVILFFALSGFVLTLQIDGARKLGYAEYAVRRICRIYLPYAGAIAFACACYALTYDGVVDWAGPWFNGGWQSSFADVDMLRHVLFVLPFQSDRLDPVVWSLVYEMRISLIFMPVVLFMRHVPTRRALLGAALASFAVCVYAVRTAHPVIQASVSTEWLPTLHYLLMFVAGAALAKHRRELMARLSGTPAARRFGYAVLAGSLLLYVAARPISFLASGVVSDYLFDWLVLLAVCGVIASAISVAPFARLLLVWPLPFLGKISYSLYLFHAVVLLAVVHATHSWLGPTSSLILAAVLIVPVSYLAYVGLERPGMRLGSLLARKLTAARAPVQGAAGIDVS